MDGWMDGWKAFNFIYPGLFYQIIDTNSNSDLLYLKAVRFLIYNYN